MIVAGPRLTKADSLRVANSQACLLQADVARFGTSVAHCLTDNPNDQAITNALETLRDMRASVNEAFHSLAAIVIDRILRDNTTLYGHNGKTYIYRGSDIYGLCVSDSSGAFKHVLRVVNFDDRGFTAERDGGTPERFTYVKHDDCGVTSDPD